MVSLLSKIFTFENVEWACDWLPGVSTLTNGLELITKPFADKPDSAPKTLKGRVNKVVYEKSTPRSFVLLLPGIGQGLLVT